MILTFAVIGGLLAALVRVWTGGRSLAPPRLRLTWLAPSAFLPQILAFHISKTAGIITDDLAAICLVASQALLLIFVWANRRRPGLWALGLGLVSNLLVIVLNGGLMPISPETLARLAPNAPVTSWNVGQRLWAGKDIVLLTSATRLPWLSDHFLLPQWFSVQVAFSPGDVLIGAAAFWLLWSTAGMERAIRRLANGGANYRARATQTNP